MNRRDEPFRLGHRPALDGVRGLAILLVLLVHSWYVWPSNLFNGGFEGVDLFFVLSGFLITSLLLEEHLETGRISLRSFYKRRALRLFPALYVMLMAAVVLWRFVPTVAGVYPLHAQLGAVGETVAYIYNWGYVFFPHLDGWGFDQVWSLGVEEQFYLFWPLLLIALLRWRPSWVGRVALSIGALSFAQGAAVWIVTQNRNDVYYPTTSRLLGLMVGAFIAWALHRGVRLGKWTTPSALVGLGFLLWMVRYGSVTDGWIYLWGGVLITFASAALLAGCIEPGPVTRVFSLRPLRYLGRISYSLYLWHYLAICTVLAIAPRATAAELIVIAYGSALTIAALSQRFIERPCIRLAHQSTENQNDLRATRALEVPA